MDIVWKSIAGGLLTGLIVFLSKRGNVLPGILPLFPTFALVALLAVGSKLDNAGFREACLAGAKTIPAYLVFLAICYLGIPYLDYRLTLAVAIAGWLVVALAIFVAPRLI